MRFALIKTFAYGSCDDVLKKSLVITIITINRKNLFLYSIADNTRIFYHR